jgi:hypothetical protein
MSPRTFDREKHLVFYLKMTTSTLVSYSVVQLGLISDLLGRSAGIVLGDLLSIDHLKFKSAGNSLILF